MTIFRRYSAPENNPRHFNYRKADEQFIYSPKSINIYICYTKLAAIVLIPTDVTILWRFTLFEVVKTLN